MIIGVIGILLFIGLMIGYFLYSLSPPLKEQMAFPPVTYESVQSYDQKVETFKTEIKAAVAAKEEKTIN